MRFRKCEICGLRSERKGDSKRFFMARYPLDEDRCKKWVQNTGNEDLVYVPIEKLNQLKFVCGLHFDRRSFTKNQARLKKTAVPTLNLTKKALPDNIFDDFPYHLFKESVHHPSTTSAPMDQAEFEGEIMTTGLPVRPPTTLAEFEGDICSEVPDYEIVTEILTTELPAMAESTTKLITSNDMDAFSSINERPVDDISLDFFYKPHTITLLAVSIAGVIYTAFVRNESDTQENIWAGICCVVFFFLIISVLTFPNGPFTRPHPAVWRIVFGMSVLYLLALLFLLFQSYSSVYEIIYWIDPNLKNFRIDSEKEYAVNCSDLSFAKVWSHVDVFAWGHFLGWLFKAILFRHAGLLWAISIMWEITEIAFAHLLPNFLECWWDSIILDVLLCNGFGIWCGLKVCKALEMREYKWVSIRDISSTRGKIKRAILQFTPVNWTPVRWLDPTCTYMRFFALSQLVVFWQISELNTFFLKHIFEMPPSHFLVIARLCLVGVIVAPSVRQYYIYVTDPNCKRVGTQCWVYGAIMTTESMLCIKNGKELFGQAQVCNVIVWLVIQMLVSIGCVYGVVLYHKYFDSADETDRSPESPKKKQ